MRIACLIATLGSGGAERVATTLCNTWVEMGHGVDLLTYQDENELSHYPIRESVRLHRLGVAGGSAGLWQRVLNVRRRIDAPRKWLRQIRPDVLVCFITGTNIFGLLAARGLGVPIVISERIHPAHHRFRWPIPVARRRLYPTANALVVQTPDIAQWFQTQLGITAAVIPNPIEVDRFIDRAKNGDRKSLVSVGRLHRQKGYDDLIAAFAPLAPAFPDWDLTILGEGPERASLEALIANLRLGGRVTLPGVVDDIPRRLASATIYVQPSRYEGFPNALLEALAAGCPVLATDAPGATSSLLQNGKYGFLTSVGDVQTLSDNLQCLMSDPELREKYTRSAPQATSPYDVNDIARQWIDLFDTVQ